MKRLAFAAALAAVLGGCAPGIVMETTHEGGVVRVLFGTGQDERHDAALKRALRHCRSQGFTGYSVVREYDENGRRNIDFKCRN